MLPVNREIFRLADTSSQTVAKFRKTAWTPEIATSCRIFSLEPPATPAGPSGVHGDDDALGAVEARLQFQITGHVPRAFCNTLSLGKDAFSRLPSTWPESPRAPAYSSPNTGCWGLLQSGQVLGKLGAARTTLGRCSVDLLALQQTTCSTITAKETAAGLTYPCGNHNLKPQTILNPSPCRRRASSHSGW